MSMQNNRSVLEEQFQALLAQAVEKVRSEEDPIVISEYKKLFKKNVPFTLRTYVAAYLAKELISGGLSLSGNSRRHGKGEKFDRSSRRESKQESFSKADRSSSPRPERDHAPTPRVSIDEDKATTIFIGMGRNRGVYARDIIGLITQRATIDRERIGDIKILDNYSFVQVYIEDADNIIALINGSDYRNRKLTVSYAHKKEKEDETSAEVSVTEELSSQE